MKKKSEDNLSVTAVANVNASKNLGAVTSTLATSSLDRYRSHRESTPQYGNHHTITSNTNSLNSNQLTGYNFEQSMSFSRQLKEGLSTSMLADSGYYACSNCPGLQHQRDQGENFIFSILHRFNETCLLILVFHWIPNNQIIIFHLV